MLSLPEIIEAIRAGKMEEKKAIKEWLIDYLFIAFLKKYPEMQDSEELRVVFRAGIESWQQLMKELNTGYGLKRVENG